MNTRHPRHRQLVDDGPPDIPPRRVCPAGPYKHGPGRLGVPIAIGVVVAMGDIVIGDSDGVVIVRYDTCAQVLERTEALIATESPNERRTHTQAR